MKIIAGFSGYGRNFAVAKRKAEKVQTTRYSGFILPQKSGRTMIKIKKVIKYQFSVLRTP